MKQLLVISGKGGTGKTTLVASFAALAKNKVLADCDVDASDLHLIMDPTIEKSQEFLSPKAVKDNQKCNDCGLCLEHCRFDAIDENFEIDTMLCEGCGVCAYVCPQDAIQLKDELSGYSFISATRYGTMSHAELSPGGEASGKLVTRVKQNARRLAQSEAQDLILIDGSPGMGCPVIASLSNVDIALIVTEPTLSGIHDLERVLGVACHFGVKPLICINKCDLNQAMTSKIEDYAGDQQVSVIGKIPYDDLVTKAMVEGKSVVEFSNGEVTREIKSIWSRLIDELELGGERNE